MNNKKERTKQYEMTKLEYVARSLSKGTYKVYETYVINAIYQKVNNPELQIETQKSVLTLDHEIKLIDLYLPQIRVAIEVNEHYHQSDIQREKDKQRECKIQEATIVEDKNNRIEFKKIEIPENYSIQDLNKEINKIVQDINSKIEILKELKWYFGKEFIEHVKNRGYIKTEDSFYQNYVIINLVCNKGYKGWQKGGYDIKEQTKEGYSCIWFPVISEEDEQKQLKSTGSWLNIYNEDKTIIFEKSDNTKKQDKKKQEAIQDYHNNIKRIVFAKERDQFGKLRKRFVGVFVADGWDDENQAERWKLESKELKIPIKYV